MITPTRSRNHARRALAALGITAVVGLVLAACGGPTDSPGSTGMPGMDHGAMTSRPSGPSSEPGHGQMEGMTGMPPGDGLTAEAAGFRFAPALTTLPAGQPAAFAFRILAADGTPVTAFEPDQTKLMHFYLIRSDLTGFQHIHPSMSADGTWTAPLAAAQPGTYRAYASFITTDSAGTAAPLVFSQQVTVPGPATASPLPAASATTHVDGYTLTLATGPITAGEESELTVTVSQNGTPVTDLQPYLDTYAHLTGFHQGDLAFAHLHPNSAVDADHGGPALSFDASLPRPGTWRLYLQFQTAGVLHTAAVTLLVD